ncbi:hypothetical protein C8J46_101661 [Sphingomonas sp. PP-F2F-A104-K0414]|nr:hypothetical protein C8J46_101661 [Sphingomonas sp. PP-F2F-A104-K0414]
MGGGLVKRECVALLPFSCERRSPGLQAVAFVILGSCVRRRTRGQNGLTITSTTISVTASAGTSLSIRKCFPASVGFPAASFFA